MIIRFNVNNSDNYLIESYKEVRKIDRQLLSANESDYLTHIIRALPPDVESTFITRDGHVLVSTIPNFRAGEQISINEMWNFIVKDSENYYFQYTTIPLEKSSAYFVTRTKRRPGTKVNPVFLPSIFLFIMFMIFICVVLVLIISRNVFRSIIIIDEKTQAISEGNLAVTITPDKELQSFNEITEILESLEKMRLSLLDAQERKNKFVMGISHDLRTPVAIIKGYTEAIVDGMISEPTEIRNSLELIGTKVTQLEDMINTLINYVKLNPDELRENLVPNSITDLIFNFAKDAKNTASVFKRNIITDINLPHNINVPLDKQLALRAFENLFGNALRYTTDYDTIELQAYEEHLLERISDNKNEEKRDNLYELKLNSNKISSIQNFQGNRISHNVVLVIKDTGIGISKKDLTHIFDLFYRGTSSRKEEGIGIGLSVVKNIIETHGWTISVESTEGVGSTFTVKIPFYPER